jgi:hypothetical protein
MDTSLINLVPNLTRALRSIKIPRSVIDDPPPPYTVACNPSPQRSEKTRTISVPFHVEILGTANSKTNHIGKRLMTYSGDDSIALGPGTTYAEFLGVLERMLSDIEAERDMGLWKASIVAESKRRRLWRFMEHTVYVTRESWGEILVDLRVGRYMGVRVVCWRV